MLAYRPLKCRLDNTHPSQMPRINGQALWQVQPDSDGVRHLRFIFPSPEGGRVHFTRYFLILKASMLMNEWKRRHAFFQSQSPSIGLPDGVRTSHVSFAVRPLTTACVRPRLQTC